MPPYFSQLNPIEHKWAQAKALHLSSSIKM